MLAAPPQNRGYEARVNGAAITLDQLVTLCACSARRAEPLVILVRGLRGNGRERLADNNRDNNAGRQRRLQRTSTSKKDLVRDAKLGDGQS